MLVVASVSWCEGTVLCLWSSHLGVSLSVVIAILSSIVLLLISIFYWTSDMRMGL